MLATTYVTQSGTTYIVEEGFGATFLTRARATHAVGNGWDSGRIPVQDVRVGSHGGLIIDREDGGYLTTTRIVARY